MNSNESSTAPWLDRSFWSTLSSSSSEYATTHRDKVPGMAGISFPSTSGRGRRNVFSSEDWLEKIAGSPLSLCPFPNRDTNPDRATVQYLPWAILFDSPRRPDHLRPYSSSSLYKFESTSSLIAVRVTLDPDRLVSYWLLCFPNVLGRCHIDQEALSKA